MSTCWFFVCFFEFLADLSRFVDVGEKEEALPICESSLDSSTVRAQDLLDGVSRKD